MARRPRIEIAGYCHIVNRGVERRVVFYDKDDFKNPGTGYQLITNCNIFK